MALGMVILLDLLVKYLNNRFDVTTNIGWLAVKLGIHGSQRADLAP